MKKKLNEIQQYISKSGELINNNIKNDYGFSYGDIVEVLRKAENGLVLTGKTDVEINTSKINISKFSEAVLEMIEKELDKKYIQFSEQDCKGLNEILYEAYTEMGDVIKHVYDKEDKENEE
jgi:hypothetical protein